MNAADLAIADRSAPASFEAEELVRDALDRHFADMLEARQAVQGDQAVLRLGPFKMQMPNRAKRQQALSLHDLHHVVTGYAATNMGDEMKLAAWEIASGAGFRGSPIGLIVQLTLMSLGLARMPRATLSAFQIGSAHRNLYSTSSEIPEFLDMTVSELRAICRRRPSSDVAVRVLFALWSAAAVVVGLVAVLVLAPMFFFIGVGLGLVLVGVPALFRKTLRALRRGPA